MLLFATLLAFQIVLVLYLDRHIQASYVYMFIPWISFEMFRMIEILRNSKMSFREYSGLDRDVSFDYVMFVMWRVSSIVARLFLIIFVALKLDHSIDWNWFLVFLPSWIDLLLFQFPCTIMMRRVMISSLDVVQDEEAGAATDDEEHARRVAHASSLYCQSNLENLALLVMQLLLCARLSSRSNDISSFLIAIPVFLPVVLFCALAQCIVFCPSLYRD